MDKFEYTIKTLAIEEFKCLEALRVEERYGVHPEYRPSEIDWQSRLNELQEARNILSNM